jgi:hypothetical protein
MSDRSDRPEDDFDVAGHRLAGNDSETVVDEQEPADVTDQRPATRINETAAEDGDG